MNQSEVNGTLDELVGGAKRKVGEITGDKKLQVKGMAQQAKGAVEKTWGKTKEAVASVATSSTKPIKTAANNRSAGRTA